MIWYTVWPEFMARLVLNEGPEVPDHEVCIAFLVDMPLGRYIGARHLKA